MSEDFAMPTEEDCPKCHEETVSRCCGACGGDGYVELYEEDPNYYRPDEVGQCHECHGQGYHEWCQRCGWDVIEKRYMNGLRLLFFPSSWTAEQKAEWLKEHEPRYHGYTDSQYMIA
jgi:hypothetical protein